jgi:hypothetical protein
MAKIWTPEAIPWDAVAAPLSLLLKNFNLKHLAKIQYAILA